MTIVLPKTTPAIVISKDQTRSFFNALNKNIPSKKFWGDCRDLRESISSSDLDAMDSLIAKRLDIHE